jgi:hypothetical protein
MAFPPRLMVHGARRLGGQGRPAAGRGPGDLVRGIALGVLRGAADLLRTTLPDCAGGPAWQELRNRLDCFEIFERVRVVPLRRPYWGLDVAGLAAGARRLGAYRALWATEALGYGLADRAWRAGGPPRGLFADGTPTLPSGLLTPLHAGAGLLFAERFLAGAGSRNRPAALRRALPLFITLCRANAREGYAGAMTEALGLVARNLYPRLVPAIDGQLSDWCPEGAEYFWHGVGRGLYFTPTSAVPWGCWAWQGLAKARSEPPHELGQLNAVAGLAWALTLVNVRHPGVLELFLRRYGHRLVDASAFANGVGSAALVWHRWAPATAYLDALCRHARGTPDGRFAARWRALVEGPCLTALAGRDPAGSSVGGTGPLFRYRPPVQWEASMPERP